MSELQTFLNLLQTRYHREEFLWSDPLECVHRFSDPWDQEAVALLSALLSYGNVKQIKRSIGDALERIEKIAEKPSVFVKSLNDPSSVARAEKAFSGWVHRFNQGSDLVVLFRLLERSWRENGSLGAHFLRFHAEDSENFGPAVNALIAEWKSWARDMGKRKGSSFDYLLTAPSDGSCCKRWCMFLRWMGRQDPRGLRLDLGLWNEGSSLQKTFPQGRVLKSSQLVIPLDTHTGRISRYLGLTRRKTLDWKAALEVTASLRRCHENDPTRYDFAISRLGILDVCQKKYVSTICEGCELVSVCKLAARGRRKKVS